MSGKPRSRSNSIKSNQDGVIKIAGYAKSIPFAALITFEIALICIVITVSLLLVASTNTASSNELSINQGIDSVKGLARTIQVQTVESVESTLLDVVSTGTNTIIDNARIFNASYMNTSDYDRMWPYFYQLVKKYPALSNVYYYNVDTKDFIGSIKTNYDPPYTYGVYLMDESKFSNLPSRCPLTCPANMNKTAKLQRYQYNLDEKGNVVAEPVIAITYDFTTRSTWKAATSVNYSTPVWAPVTVFSNGKDVGVNVGIQVFTQGTSTATKPTLKGVYAVNFSFGVLKQPLQNLPLTKNGFALVFDINGNLFGSSIDSENVTIASTVAGGSPVIKTVFNLTDPASAVSMKYLISRLSTGGVVNGAINLDGLEGSASYVIPQTQMSALANSINVTSAPTSSDFILLLKAVTDPYNLRVFVLIGAPVSDYTGNIEATSNELRSRLGRSNVLMILIGAALVVAFVLLSFPVTFYLIATPLNHLAKHMEEASRFEFSSLHGKDRNERSLIREFAIMQTAYWNMIYKFANAIDDNRRLTSNNRKNLSQTGTTSITTNMSANVDRNNTLQRNKD
ncbi:hypothetical protein HDU97_008969 [Phlyctochytrium planicorne]|nr:hypothetical protein HDU97_008969 [Phlyctochytrium planicorne]